MQEGSASSGSGRKVFTLLVEMRCNSYCLFCGQREVDEALVRARRRLALAVPRNEHAGVHARYTLASATEALERARREGFTELSFQGGEPTIWPDLPELVGRARAMGFEFVGAVTNGRRLADRAFAVALLEAGLHGITISLLGPDAATHDELSAAPGAFDALSTGMRNVAEIVRERGIPVLVGAHLIVTSKNVGALDRCIELLAAHGIRSATLRLVRFDHMGSDPLVREMLKIDGHVLADALGRARAAATASGVDLQSIDLPECMHPSLDPDRLARRASARDVDLHHYEGADFQYDVLPRADAEPACASCLLVGTCARLPEGHLLGSPSPFRPFTEAALSARLDAKLGAMNPRERDAVRELLAERESYVLLERAARKDGALATLRARVDAALVDVMSVAFQAQDEEQLLVASGAIVGFDRRGRTFSFDPARWPSAMERVRVLELNGAAGSAGAVVLCVGAIDVRLEGTTDGEAFRVSSVLGLRWRDRAVDANARRAARLHLVAAASLSSLFERRRLVVGRDRFTILREDEPSLFWTIAPGAIRWRGSAERADALPADL